MDQYFVTLKHRRLCSFFHRILNTMAGIFAYIVQAGSYDVPKTDACPNCKPK